MGTAYAEQKNFSLVKVCKINLTGSSAKMTFLAQDDGSGERNLFRCVVCELEDEVWLCEIKDVGEISLLVDHVEEYFQKVAERVEDPPSSARTVLLAFFFRSNTKAVKMIL